MVQMANEDIEFLENSFKQYYFEHSDMIGVPERAAAREFGYQKFNSGMIRHLRIKNDNQLRLLFMKNVPSDVYCSNAYYSFPELPMNEKDWKEADLIFDIDAKDLQLPCRSNHTISICEQCHNVSTGNDSCSACGSLKIKKRSLPCKACMDASKVEVSKLTRILTNDLNVNEADIDIYFSGNEGFHVYAYHSQFGKLDSRARSDLVDYIMFRGAIPERFGMKKTSQPTNNDISTFPDFEQSGWRARFSAEVYGSKSKRNKIIRQLKQEGYASFQSMLDDLTQRIGVRIDPNVTMDVHRIFRLPGSLNSKSGLAKIPCASLEKFDPYMEAPLLNDDPVDVFADCPVRFRLKREQFGPFTNHQKVTVPTFAAAYMVCKGLASTVVRKPLGPDSGHGSDTSTSR